MIKNIILCILILAIGTACDPARVYRVQDADPYKVRNASNEIEPRRQEILLDHGNVTLGIGTVFVLGYLNLDLDIHNRSKSRVSIDLRQLTVVTDEDDTEFKASACDQSEGNKRRKVTSVEIPPDGTLGFGCSYRGAGDLGHMFGSKHNSTLTIKMPIMIGAKAEDLVFHLQ